MTLHCPQCRPYYVKEWPTHERGCAFERQPWCFDLLTKTTYPEALRDIDGYELADVREEEVNHE